MAGFLKTHALHFSMGENLVLIVKEKESLCKKRKIFFKHFNQIIQRNLDPTNGQKLSHCLCYCRSFIQSNVKTEMTKRFYPGKMALQSCAPNCLHTVTIV